MVGLTGFPLGLWKWGRLAHQAACGFAPITAVKGGSSHRSRGDWGLEVRGPAWTQQAQEEPCKEGNGTASVNQRWPPPTPCWTVGDGVRGVGRIVQTSSEEGWCCLPRETRPFLERRGGFSLQDLQWCVKSGHDPRSLRNPPPLPLRPAQTRRWMASPHKGSRLETWNSDQFTEDSVA